MRNKNLNPASESAKEFSFEAALENLSIKEWSAKIPEHINSAQENVLEELLAKKTDAEIEQCIKDNLETIKAQDPESQFDLLHLIAIKADFFM